MDGHFTVVYGNGSEFVLNFKPDVEGATAYHGEGRDYIGNNLVIKYNRAIHEKLEIIDDEFESTLSSVSIIEPSEADSSLHSNLTFEEEWSEEDSTSTVKTLVKTYPM